MNKIKECAKLLSNEDRCFKAMEKAVNQYPISAEQHLSKDYGRRPWLGQAACCVELGATEEETRIAWNFYMTAQAQERANLMADMIAKQWGAGNA